MAAEGAQARRPWWSNASTLLRRPRSKLTGKAGQPNWDVLVIGGGIAGLCAAIAARRRGVSVRLVESAPTALRGGNARHARNFRLAHDAPTRHSPGVYTSDEFLAELRKVSGEAGNGALARSLIGESVDIASWLMSCGVRLQDPAVGVIPYSRRTAFLLGGGKAMINALYQTAENIGVVISYDSEATTLCRADKCAWEATIGGAERRETLTARSLIAAAGGPGGDPDWLRAQFGPMADNFMIRGSSYSNGGLMQRLVDLGAEAVGHPTTCHMVAVDARGPKFDGGIVTRITAIPLGLVVDRNGESLTLANDNAGPSHYAEWGPRIAGRPGGAAFLILESEQLRRAKPAALAPVQAESCASLARALGLDPVALAAAIEAFNSNLRPGARPIKTPPFAAFPMRPGITFLHFGLAVDGQMRVALSDGRVFDNLFAAGMIMAANILPHGYIAGFGITLSVLSGRRAGEAAARYVLG